MRGKNISQAVKRINPIILGWRNYFRKYTSSRIFNKLDNWIYLKCWNYATRLHPKKGKRWIYNKYFGYFVAGRKNRWVFGDKSTGRHIQKLSWAGIKRHVLVKGYNSIYDPSLANYWDIRSKRNFKETHPPSEIKVAQKQEFLCPVCNTSLYGEEELDIHHLIPQTVEKIDTYWNLSLVHRSCHRVIHSNKSLELSIVKRFLPNPERIIKKNTPPSWERAIRCYLENSILDT